MTLHARVLQCILEEPGTSKQRLCRRFDLNRYRLRRVFQKIDEGLSGRSLVQDDLNGVWIVAMDPEKCAGTIWLGGDEGGYVQCSGPREFADGRCYDHSGWENPEMIAFERRLRWVAGPCEASARVLAQLTMTVLEDLAETLSAVNPVTFRQLQEKKRLAGMLRSAMAFVRWKQRARPSASGSWIPPEFAERLRRSSGNTFEFAVKQHFLVLEVTSDAGRDEVVKAWRKLARRYHPDAEGGDEERMKLINLAKDRIFLIRGWD
ncbi:MAG: DnaJ domain-containing protein [Desulfomonile tiedjei]|nr:DnaJ domain-containing protein [Desulfomonile tiedjei]